MGKVWFIGAGPGDPELLTLKGQRLIREAGAILYAGSLVNRAATQWAGKETIIKDSKGMTLDQINGWLIEQAQRHQTVIRLQTGDPSLYGALVEMVRPLDAAAIEVGVVPGVSSAFASAAAAVESLTLPEITQSVILTRIEGRTPMPEGEALRDLASHHSTLCIFLSITLIDKVTSELNAAGWSSESPIVVVQKASWPGEEVIVRGSLADIAAKIAKAGIKSQAMIIASPALGARHWESIQKSKLYDASFGHRFRKAVP